jgi:hypothetical protein
MMMQRLLLAVASATQINSAAAASPLPLPAACYFDAVDAQDAAAIASCFAESGEIIDVGRRIAGREAIADWARNEVVGGRYSIEEVQPILAGVAITLRFAPSGRGNSFRAIYGVRFEDGRIIKMRLRYA